MLTARIRDDDLLLINVSRLTGRTIDHQTTNGIINHECLSWYQVASDDLKELAELEIKTERIRLATLRNGKARRELEKILRDAFLEKSIPNQNSSGPADKDAPELAVVMSDGGRYQRFDRGGQKSQSSSFWKESRMAILLSMKTKSHQEDPNADLPDFLRDFCIAKKLAQIGGVAGENPSVRQLHQRVGHHARVVVQLGSGASDLP